MRPLGVSVIAVFTWIRGALYTVAGLAILGIGHLSTRLLSAAASDSFAETLVSRLGKALGFGALVIAAVYVVVGVGLWGVRNWARVLTLVFVGLWFVIGLVGLARHPSAWHIVRTVVEVVILVYLNLPDTKRVFAAA